VRWVPDAVTTTCSIWVAGAVEGGGAGWAGCAVCACARPGTAAANAHAKIFIFGIAHSFTQSWWLETVMPKGIKIRTTSQQSREVAKAGDASGTPRQNMMRIASRGKQTPDLAGLTPWHSGC
jgi:hypothetical protein